MSPYGITFTAPLHDLEKKGKGDSIIPNPRPGEKKQRTTKDMTSKNKLKDRTR